MKCLLSLILACCLGGFVTADETNWHRFHSLEGSFSVKTTVAPRVQVIFHPAYVTTRHLFYADGVAQMILAIDVKQIDPDVAAMNRLESHIQAVVTDVKGELVWTKEASENQLHFAIQEGDLYQVGALHAIGTHIISIARVGDGAAPNVWDDKDRFLNSLRTYAVDTTHYYAAREFLVANNVETLMAKGVRHTMDGQVAEAVGVARVQALLAYEQSGASARVTADYLEELGRSLISTSRFVEADAHLRHAKRIYDKHDETEKQRLRIFRSLGLIAQQTGRFDEADRFMNEALRVAKQTGDQNVQADVLFAMAKLSHIRGDLEQAYRRAEQWNNFAKTLPVKKTDDIIFATDIDDRQASFDALMGAIERSRGNLVVAKRHLSLAIKSYEELPSARLGAANWKTLAAMARLTLGTVELDQENYSEARFVLSEALQQLSQDLGTLHPATLEGLTDLAHANERLGDFDAARALFTQILERRIELFGEPHHAVASTLASLSQLEFRAGNVKAGYEYMMSATKMDSAIPPEQHPQLAAAIQGRGNFLLLAKQYSGAEEVFVIAADTLEKRSIDSPTQVVSLMMGHGVALWGQGKYQAATEKFNAALALAQEALGDDAPQVALLLEKLADVSVSTNQIDVAAQQFHQSRQSMTRFVHGQLRELGESEQLKFLASEFQPAMHHAVQFASSHASSQTASSLAAQWLVNGKGVSVAALTQSKRNRSDALPWVTTEQLQSELREHEALIDYFRIDDISDEHDPRYIACVTTARGTPVLIELGRADQIDALVQKLRQSIDNAPAQIVDLGESDAEVQIRKQLRAVAKQLLDPCLAHIGNVDRLYLSPDAATWLIPWDALVTAKDQYAVEQYSIGLLTSGREIVRSQTMWLAADSHQRTPAVVLADPAYGQANAESIATRGGDVPTVSRLRATAGEADVVAPLISKMTLGDAIELRGQQATEKSVRRVRRPAMIHLATHGFFHDSVSTSRPLDQCGLMLAACNTAGESDGEMDGVWLGSEIVQSDFAGTDLVVLSACDTGIGQARMGEGIAGLRHAFHLAGARAVVASLWKANDAETSALMKDFYTALEQNQKRDVSLGVREGVRASLRKAKLKRISDRRQANLATHPVFWAAFDVSG